MTSKENQHKKIWNLMEEKPEGITPMDAWNILFITKLATRIGEMIRMGYPIEKIPEARANANDEMRRYMRYRKAA